MTRAREVFGACVLFSLSGSSLRPEGKKCTSLCLILNLAEWGESLGALRQPASPLCSFLSAAQLQNKTKQGHSEQLQLLTQRNWREAIRHVVKDTACPQGYSLWSHSLKKTQQLRFSAFIDVLKRTLFSSGLVFCAFWLDYGLNMLISLCTCLQVQDIWHTLEKIWTREPKPDSSDKVQAIIWVCFTRC